MTHTPYRQRSAAGNRATRVSKRSRQGPTRFRRPWFEVLEPRLLLDGAADYNAVTPAWFAQVASAAPEPVPAIYGPLTAAAGTSSGGWESSAEVAQWIVRLTETATEQAGSVPGVKTLLDSDSVAFDVVRGLGLPGQVLLRSAAPDDQVRAALAGNAAVATFEPDAYVFAQQLPNDPDFPSMTSLHNVGQFGSTPDADIDAPEAWDENTGSTSVVVGVIDSGIDVTHHDLYLNIWLNQEEIPTALKSSVTDADADGRITFYDLNDPANAAFVKDFNLNTYIDAQDLLTDPRWADGVDTDKNGFVDDFFGWNFRVGADEPFAPNDPRDALGHGTHVAGTIGAIGNNGRGVTGINWRSSLMSLRFLDETNQGQTSDAVLAVNYATMMRQDFAENVRVLNASWGQSGSASPALRTAIESAGEAGILFVAAAGNGNILGQGINLDSSPFYPASYDLDNIIAVAATGPNDELARFSNFGPTTVDLAAPGIGVLSTFPGGRYGTANGTSMAVPHVAGTAALIWSEIPVATVAEVRQAILSGVDPLPELESRTVTGGRLNAPRTLDSDAFAPRASIVNAPNITTAGGSENFITVSYHDRKGIDETSLGDGDLLVSRQWGPKDQLPATLVPGSMSIADGGGRVTVVYRVAAPGGTWDALDYGRYVVSVADQQVENVNGLSVPTGEFGDFSVRIADPSVFYVNSSDDAADANVGDGIAAAADGRTTLRAAIQEANAAAPAPRTIVLDAGTWKLTRPPVEDATVSFPSDVLGGTPLGSPTPWSNGTTGDLDVLGTITILGDTSRTSTIDAAGLDRVFRVYPSATLMLQRIAITGGVPSAGRDGGGVLTAGVLQMDNTLVTHNSTAGAGGGIAVWGGTAQISQSTISDNVATGNGGGGVFVCNQASVDIIASTLARNVAPQGGGGLLSRYGGLSHVTNSTLSGNDAGDAEGGAVGQFSNNGYHSSPALSADGRFVAFDSYALLVPGDTDGTRDVFVYDRENGTVERVSVAVDADQPNGPSYAPSLSEDGRFVAFASDASNLVPDDTNGSPDAFLYDRQSRTMERVSVAADGTQGNSSSYLPSVSADGRFVAYASLASNLVPRDSKWLWDVFVYDRQDGTVERVSVAADGTQGNGSSYSPAPSLSADGRFVAFRSEASNLVPNDTNAAWDIFVYDRTLKTVERVNVAADGGESDSFSTSPTLSADGRFVAFASDASNLVPGDTNGTRDIFVYDRTHKTIERVNVAADGEESNYFSDSPSLSADGRFVAFRSEASNLVSGDMNGKSDVFVYGLTDGTIERVSLATDGTQGNSVSDSPSLGADGRFVAFRSDASNLVPGDTTETSDVFVYDRENQTQTTTANTNAPSVNPVLLEQVTIAENWGASAVFGIVVTHNSLYAGNAARDTRSVDLGRGASSQGHNLISGADTTVTLLPSDRVAANSALWLGPLQDNGGPTWTHALLAVCPATDGAEPVHVPATDQRGIARPQDGNGTAGAQPDIGAFESFEGEVRGVVFEDLDRDGQQDWSERGLAGQMVYLDVNQNGFYDIGEPSTASEADDPNTPNVMELGTFAFLGLTPGVRWVTPRVASKWSQTSAGPQLVSVAAYGPPGDRDESRSPSLSADGRFVAFASWASNLVSGDTNTTWDVFVSDRQSGTMERVSVAADGKQGDSFSTSPALSADGRFVAFVSDASNLVQDDTNDNWDVFVYDRQKAMSEPDKVERVSVDEDRRQVQPVRDWTSGPALSADGRFVAFASDAKLVSDDTNDYSDVFVYDRQSRTIERVSVGAGGEDSDADSAWYSAPALSADGRLVAFASDASNLVPDDTNNTRDVFVYDRDRKTTKRVSVAADGKEANSYSDSPSLSADGRFVAFVSDASNLVPDDTNETKDVFVYDLQSATPEGDRVERLSVAASGAQGDGCSDSPSLSADGRFVAFRSDASNLVPPVSGDTNKPSNIFIYDRQKGTIERVSVAADGKQGNFVSDSPWLSPDGRFVAFRSDASNLVPGDTNGVADVFVALNRAAVGAGTRSVALFAGQVLSNVDFGLMPDPGEIRGQCFQDVIPNGTYDAGEPAQAGCWVYLDANGNGRYDSREQSAVTDTNGNFAFRDLPSEQEYRVGVVVPTSFSLVLPAGQDDGVWKVYLPAGGRITSCHFGFSQAQTGGQSANATLTGRIFADLNGNGGQDADEPGLSGETVFLDLNDDGVRQFNERQQLTDDDGQYAFANLGSGRYAVRPLDVHGYHQTVPIGNHFARREYLLALPDSPLGSPQDAALGDFNGDGWSDLAAAIYERNSVAMLLNDQLGGFVEPLIEIPLAPADQPTTEPRGLGPVGLLAGDFNGLGGTDLAVVNSLSSSVAILLEFDGQRFSSGQYVDVGLWPRAITASDLDGDGDMDLIVSNDLVAGETTKNVSILRNNGLGAFTADAGPPSAGNKPRSVVTGDFNEDGRPDFAVADFGTHPSGADFGDVRVLLADGGGSFASQLACPVGIGPTALAAADLDGDNHLDLAVANSLSNNVTVCLGAGNGAFQAAATLSGGTGPMDVVATDVDADGDVDLLVTSGASTSVSILRNRSTPGQLAFEPAETFGAGDWKLPAHVSLAVGDLDRNGIVDLAVTISEANKAAVHLNALAGGAQRVALTGTETVTDVDFSFQPVSAPLTVTVDQASGQRDPTNAEPLHFRVVFSEAVSDFAAEDVTLSGTAPGTLVAVVSGSGSTYDVAVSGMTDTGTVIASLAAGAAHSDAGHPSRASDVLDNQIAYTPWHNTLDALDVNGNGTVEALDALVLINYINAHPGEPQLPAPPAAAHPFYDVNLDQACTANDVLLVINDLNRGDNPEAEGERPDVAVPPPFADLQTASFSAPATIVPAGTAWPAPQRRTREEPAVPEVGVGVMPSNQSNVQTAARVMPGTLAEDSEWAESDILDAIELDQLLSQLAGELVRLQRCAE